MGHNTNNMKRYIINNLIITTMEKKEKKQAIREQFPVGAQVNASMRVEKIGREYITCVSVMDSVHTVKYTIDEFYSNFLNK